jgi:alpha-ketoglutarate-dependent taurine dioxygenase
MSAVGSLNARAGASAWTKSTIDSNRSWYYSLPPDAIHLFSKTVADYRAGRRKITDLSPTDEEREACRGFIDPVRSALESGRGFAIIDRVPVDELSAEESTAIYWLIGKVLGEPFEQNVQGTLLYNVRDTGQSVAEGARFSVTNYESSFHTDNSFGREVLDYVGLLCLKVAKSGGLSQAVSGHAVARKLQKHHRDSFEILCQPFHIERRGGIREGQRPTIEYPIVEQQAGEMLWRYLRYWIEAGHEKAGRPLTVAQVRALDNLDSVLGQPELRVEFALEPGQIYFINNRWILHNRTAFQDHSDSERRRHLVRLWLQRGRESFLCVK